MPYRLDDMGDERFQQLCQAILVREEPTLRCYPLGQTDGGRDSARNAGRDGRGRLVHQVKWTRHPDRVRNPVGWLTSAINGEADNIRRLVDEGLERYMLITNISGTAAPGSGTIDRLDKELDKLSEHYRVPIQCWWKDDLERRLDSAPTSLKLTYSEILVGIDAYRALIAGELKGERANQIGALLRRVSAAQWDTDAVVRFKQVEMDAADLDTLFVDVPARSLSRSTERDQFAGRRLPDLTPTGTATVAATTLLIGSPAAKVVILGAPGQGKSTLLQYACQTYRATLLGKQRQLGNQQTRDDRFPLRTELRDYALWVEGKDPFEEPTSGDYRRRPRGSRPSLESYLARQLSHQSGGDEVDLDTVREVFDRYPVLLALDGLDEVASAEVRRTVVQEIEAATARLWQGACKPLVVITARPSFSNLPEPSRQEFDYHELTSLTDQLRRDYLRKWTKAQRLDTRDARELVRVFNARSTDSHVRELAENPMQLAILLFLIHQRGESVPTHRTQLFSDYMGKFLDREAAKTPAVAQYRDLLEDVTRFLGWYLHSTAESAASNGRATLKKLKREMSHYLVDQGKSPDLVDVLFTAVTEKVWALTSRVQTSFEFEVQSVREYFAAEHLVQSAPVSRTSSLPDKFDRFRALAVRPYWMNTVRFMAGLFSPGELAGLRDVLDEAREDDPDRFWMRRVAMVLLADGVFDPKPKVRRQLIHSTFDDAGQRILLHDIGSGEAQPLNPDHGREDLTQLLQQLITADPRSALTSERALLLARHMARDDALSWWREMLAADGPNALDAWLGVGVPLRVGQGLASDALDELSQRDVEAPTLLLAAGANPASGSPAEEAMVAAVLDGRGHGAPWPSLAADLFHALHPARFVSMLPPLVRTSDSGRSEIVLSDASTAHLGLKVADDHAVKAAVGRLRRKDDLAPVERRDR